MNKEEVKTELKGQLDKLFVKIDELEAKKDQATGEAKELYSEKLQDLKDTTIDLKTKYDSLLEASEEKWEEIKDTLSDSLSSFKEGFSKLGDMFK
ncbi:MAG: hypothetical protein AB8B53_01720 [Flavobacteriales bacterium]